MRHLPTLAVAAVSLALIAGDANAQERRELGPHQHGHGKLNIAIEGNKVSIELDTPGADIIGFEHEAKTKADKATLAKGMQQLSRPLQLFVIPAAAGCIVKEAKAEIEKGEHEDPGDHTAETKGGAAEAQHMDFNANYVLECKKPGAIGSIRFDYFKFFAGAQELDVNVVSEKGQKSYEVTRSNPTIDLAGLL
jgi:hypothetical protein